MSPLEIVAVVFIVIWCLSAATVGLLVWGGLRRERRQQEPASVRDARWSGKLVDLDAQRYRRRRDGAA